MGHLLLVVVVVVVMAQSGMLCAKSTNMIDHNCVPVLHNDVRCY